jgi:hypothetical protein
MKLPSLALLATALIATMPSSSEATPAISSYYGYYGQGCWSYCINYYYDPYRPYDCCNSCYYVNANYCYVYSPGSYTSNVAAPSLTAKV